MAEQDGASHLPKKRENPTRESFPKYPKGSVSRMHTLQRLKKAFDSGQCFVRSIIEQTASKANCKNIPMGNAYIPTTKGRKRMQSNSNAEPTRQKTKVCFSKPKEFKILMRMALTLMGIKRKAHLDSISPARVFW